MEALAGSAWTGGAVASCAPQTLQKRAVSSFGFPQEMQKMAVPPHKQGSDPTNGIFLLDPNNPIFIIHLSMDSWRQIPLPPVIDPGRGGLTPGSSRITGN